MESCEKKFVKIDCFTNGHCKEFEKPVSGKTAHSIRVNTRAAVQLYFVDKSGNEALPSVSGLDFGSDKIKTNRISQFRKNM